MYHTEMATTTLRYTQCDAIIGAPARLEHWISGAGGGVADRPDSGTRSRTQWKAIWYPEKRTESLLGEAAPSKKQEGATKKFK